MNRLSLLNEIPKFDLCQCLPHDIMHVILEGVLPRHIQFLLHNMIFVQHYFTLQQVNQQISNFPYGYSEEVNKPRILDRDRIYCMDQKIVQSGKCIHVLHCTCSCQTTHSHVLYATYLSIYSIQLHRTGC